MQAVDPRGTATSAPGRHLRRRLDRALRGGWIGRGLACASLAAACVAVAIAAGAAASLRGASPSGPSRSSGLLACAAGALAAIAAAAVARAAVSFGPRRLPPAARAARRLDRLGVALATEARHPRLGERLSRAVEFLDDASDDASADGRSAPAAGGDDPLARSLRRLAVAEAAAALDEAGDLAVPGAAGRLRWIGVGLAVTAAVAVSAWIGPPAWRAAVRSQVSSDVAAQRPEAGAGTAAAPVDVAAAIAAARHAVQILRSALADGPPPPAERLARLAARARAAADEATTAARTRPADEPAAMLAILAAGLEDVAEALAAPAAATSAAPPQGGDAAPAPDSGPGNRSSVTFSRGENIGGSGEPPARDRIPAIEQTASPRPATARARLERLAAVSAAGDRLVAAAALEARLAAVLARAFTLAPGVNVDELATDTQARLGRLAGIAAECRRAVAADSGVLRAAIDVFPAATNDAAMPAARDAVFAAAKDAVFLAAKDTVFLAAKDAVRRACDRLDEVAVAAATPLPGHVAANRLGHAASLADDAARAIAAAVDALGMTPSTSGAAPPSDLAVAGPPVTAGGEGAASASPGPAPLDRTRAALDRVAATILAPLDADDRGPSPAAGPADIASESPPAAAESARPAGPPGGQPSAGAARTGGAARAGGDARAAAAETSPRERLWMLLPARERPDRGGSAGDADATAAAYGPAIDAYYRLLFQSFSPAPAPDDRPPAAGSDAAGAADTGSAKPPAP